MAEWVKKDLNRESTIEFKPLTREQVRSVIGTLANTGALECVYSERMGRFFPMMLTVLGFFVVVGVSLLSAWKMGWL